MTVTLPEQISQMSREIALLRKRVVVQQVILLGLLVIIVASLCMGAASQDGHFDRVFAKSVTICNAQGEPAAKLYAVDGAGSLSILDSSGREAIHLISGSERNDLLINDRNNGRIAVAVQGMKDRGRLSLLRTFQDVDIAKQTLGKKMRDYLINGKGQVAVPVLRLPE